ncbi:hypothetical protein KCU65_g65, partial [Aureobasidium melanogenum]
LANGSWLRGETVYLRDGFPLLTADVTEERSTGVGQVDGLRCGELTAECRRIGHLYCRPAKTGKSPTLERLEGARHRK